MCKKHETLWNSQKLKTKRFNLILSKALLIKISVDDCEETELISCLNEWTGKNCSNQKTSKTSVTSNIGSIRSDIRNKCKSSSITYKNFFNHALKAKISKIYYQVKYYLTSFNVIGGFSNLKKFQITFIT